MCMSLVLKVKGIGHDFYLVTMERPFQEVLNRVFRKKCSGALKLILSQKTFHIIN